jgi:hypothetical protein
MTERLVVEHEKPGDVKGGEGWKPRTLGVDGMRRA